MFETVLLTNFSVISVSHVFYFYIRRSIYSKSMYYASSPVTFNSNHVSTEVDEFIIAINDVAEAWVVNWHDCICSWVRPQTHHFIGDYTKSVRCNWVNSNLHIFHVAMNLLKNSSNLTKYIVFNLTINGLVNGDN